MKELTISIAAYNVEKYLQKALDSICKSGILDDVEIIVVDDGSKDKTSEIGKEYEKRYPGSIKCITKPNGGHGSTINVGLQNATGKYFRVLDGDDWVDPRGFSKYINKLKIINTDIIISNKKLVYPNREEYITFPFLKEGIEYNIDPKYPYNICTLSTMAVKTKLLKNNGIKITENSFYVDMEFVIHSILNSKTFYYINENVYMYRLGQTEQSVSKQIMLKRITMLDNVNKNLFNIFDSYKSPNEVKEFAFKRIMNATGALYRTYFLKDKIADCTEGIKQFENYIRLEHEKDYHKLSSDAFIKSIRLFNYMFLPIIRIIYLVRCKRKKLI